MSKLITATIYYPGATSTSSIALYSDLVLVQEVTGSSTIYSSISLFGDVGNLGVANQVYNATNTVASIVLQSSGSLVQATVVQITTPQGSPYRLPASLQYAFPCGGAKIEEATGTNISAKITYRGSVYFVTETLAALTSASNQGVSASVSVAGSNVTTTVATAADITGLTAPVAANKRYKLTGVLWIGCDNTGGVQIALNAPSGSALLSGTLIGSAGAAATCQTVRAGTIGTLSAAGATFMRASSTGGMVTVTYYFTTSTTTGNATLQFASNVGGQTSTVYIGSSMDLVEIQ